MATSPQEFFVKNYWTIRERFGLYTKLMPKLSETEPGYCIISYARLLELLAQKKVRRIYLFGPDCLDCIVEVPMERDFNPILRETNIAGKLKARMTDPEYAKSVEVKAKRGVESLRRFVQGDAPNAKKQVAIENDLYDLHDKREEPTTEEENVDLFAEEYMGQAMKRLMKGKRRLLPDGEMKTALYNRSAYLPFRRNIARSRELAQPSALPEEYLQDAFKGAGMQSSAKDRASFNLDNTVMDDRFDINWKKNAMWDGSTMFYAVNELNEFEMSKNAYFCPLPGDFWLDAKFLNTIKNNIPVVDKVENKVINPLKKGQVRCDLTIFPENEGLPQLFFNVEGYFFPIFWLLMYGTAINTLKLLRTRISNPFRRVPRSKIATDDVTESKAKEVQGKTGVTLDMVAGVDAIKSELVGYVKALKAAKEFEIRREEAEKRNTWSQRTKRRLRQFFALLGSDSEIDAESIRTQEEADAMLLSSSQAMQVKTPRGVILQGPPGTGKTYLAKALANDMGLPFYAVSGSDFVEVFEGVAAERMGNLFTKARENAPSIVFIDEIDAIGMERGEESSGDSGESEREAGLLEMLTNLDGAGRQTDGVLCIGATNRYDILDRALVRAGRFERVFFFDTPSENDRRRILDIHLTAKGMMKDGGDAGKDAMLTEVARLTQGFTGASLESLLNEAAIKAAKEGFTSVTSDLIVKMILEKKFGLAGPGLPPSPLKTHIAYVAAAEAIEAAINSSLTIEVVTMLKRHNKLQGTVVYAFGAEPRRKFDAYTYHYYRQEVVRRYMTRACEEYFFGEDEVTNLTQQEVQEATQYANWYIRNSGLDPELGKNIHDMWMGTSSSGKVKLDASTAFPEVWKFLDDKVRDLLDRSYARAKVITHARRRAIKALAEELLENDEVTGVGVDKVLAENPPDVLGKPITSYGGTLPAQASGSVSFSGAGTNEEVVGDGGTRVSRKPGKSGKVSMGRAALPANQMMATSFSGLTGSVGFEVIGGKVGTVSFRLTQGLLVRSHRTLPGTVNAGKSLMNWMGLTIDDFPKHGTLSRDELEDIIATRDEDVRKKVMERARGGAAPGSEDMDSDNGVDESTMSMHYIAKYVPPGYKRFHGQVEVEVPESFQKQFEEQYGPLPGPYTAGPLDGIDDYAADYDVDEDHVEPVFDW